MKCNKNKNRKGTKLLVLAALFSAGVNAHSHDPYDIQEYAFSTNKMITFTLTNFLDERLDFTVSRDGKELGKTKLLSKGESQPVRITITDIPLSKKNKQGQITPFVTEVCTTSNPSQGFATRLCTTVQLARMK